MPNFDPHTGREKKNSTCIYQNFQPCRVLTPECRLDLKRNKNIMGLHLGNYWSNLGSFNSTIILDQFGPLKFKKSSEMSNLNKMILFVVAYFVFRNHL